MWTLNKKVSILASTIIILLLLVISLDTNEQTTQQASPTPALEEILKKEPVVEEVLEETEDTYTPPETQDENVLLNEIQELPKKTYITPQVKDTIIKVEKVIVEIIEEPVQNCHPNYSGCLLPEASDYDCAGGSGNGPYYTGKVKVLGKDVFGLDRDKDGWGCE